MPLSVFFHFAIVFGFTPYFELNAPTEAFDHCSTARTACVVVALPWSIWPIDRPSCGRIYLYHHMMGPNNGALLKVEKASLPRHPNPPLAIAEREPRCDRKGEVFLRCPTFGVGSIVGFDIVYAARNLNAQEQFSCLIGFIEYIF